MRKLIIPAIAIAMAFASSAFTSKRSTSNFYEYQSSSHAKADIQNINNYLATTADPCSGATNVCGVTLSTAHTVGTTPVPAEFSAEEGDLWSSQENSAPADMYIGMKD